MKTSSNHRPSKSVARTRMLYVLFVAASNAAAVRNWLPDNVKEALSAAPLPDARVKANDSPESGSVADSNPTSAPADWCSTTTAGPNAMSVGLRASRNL